jgi:hypothetical protein
MSPAQETYESEFFDYSVFFDCSDLLPGKSDRFENIAVEKSAVFLLTPDGVRYLNYSKGALKRKEPSYTMDPTENHQAHFGTDPTIMNFLGNDEEEPEELVDRVADGAPIFDPTTPRNHSEYSLLKRVSIHDDPVVGYRVFENPERGEFFAYLEGETFYLYPSEKVIINNSARAKMLNDLFDSEGGQVIGVGQRLIYDGVVPTQIIMSDPKNHVGTAKPSSSLKNRIVKGRIAVEGFENVKVTETEEVRTQAAVNGNPDGTLIPAPEPLRPGEDEDYYERRMIVHYAKLGIFVDLDKVPRDPYPHEKIVIDGVLGYTDYYAKLSGKKSLEDEAEQMSVLECYLGTDILTYYGYAVRYAKDYDNLSTQEKIDHLVMYIPYLESVGNEKPDKKDFVKDCINGEDGVKNMIGRLELAKEQEEVEAYFSQDGGKKV